MYLYEWLEGLYESNLLAMIPCIEICGMNQTNDYMNDWAAYMNQIINYMNNIIEYCSSCTSYNDKSHCVSS